MNYRYRSLMKLTVIAIVLVGIQVPLDAQDSNKSSSDSWQLIQAVMTKQQQAWNEGNLEAFMEGYWNSPKLTFSSGGNTTRGWRPTLDRYKKSYDTKAKMGQLQFSNLEYQKLSENVALVLGVWTLTLDDAKPTGNFSLVFQKFDTGWKVVHDHSSTLEESR